MRWDSPFVLAAAGTLAIHTLIAVGADAIVVTHPLHPDPPPPRVELFDIKYDPPPPPPSHHEEAKPEPAKPIEPAQPAPRTHAAPSRVQTAAPAPVPEQAPAQPTVPDAIDPGGAPDLTIPDLGPPGTGVTAKKGPRTTGAIGHGGTGGRTGSGSGGGAGSDRPVSVATIKQRALPRGDFGYLGLGKDYPAEAKRLGIEGDIQVELVVDDRGKVRSRRLVPPGLGHGLDELALERAQLIEFTPALDTDNHPVSSVVVWTFRMTLPK